MKTIKFKVHLDTGFVTAEHRDELEIEVEDDATEEQIQQALDAEARDWAMNKIEYWYEIIE